MEIMLKTLYINGWRYIFRKEHCDEFCISKEKPGYSEYGRITFHPQHQALLSDTSSMLIADAMKGYNYITIADHIDIVDWSTVKVDTPVKVFYDNGDFAYRSHFADYVDGQVYVFPDGTTSWSATQEPVPVKNVKLNED